MTTQSHTAAKTGLLLLDPYNDLMSEGGKLFVKVKDVATQVNLFGNLRKILSAARATGIQVFVVPHRRSRAGDFVGWQHLSPAHSAAKDAKLFEEGTWGGDWHPEFGPQEGDVVAKEHWAQSGFANTDLDELLKQHGVESIVCIGGIANTSVESTARYGMELGYRVTLVKDATVAFSTEAMNAAHAVNAPMFAHSVVTTAELLAEFPVQHAE